MNGDLIGREDALNALKGVIARTGAYGVSIEVILANIPAVEAEPVVHAHWVDRYGGRFVNPLYECSACLGKALFEIKVDGLGHEYIAQMLSNCCPHCGAHMNEEVTE